MTTFFPTFLSEYIFVQNSSPNLSEYVYIHEVRELLRFRIVKF